jgi:NitT/TauT family transport system permease protein
VNQSRARLEGPRPTRASFFQLRREIPVTLAFLLGAALLVCLLGIWSVLTYGGIVQPLFLPSPSDVLHRGMIEAQSGVLWTDLSVSVYRITMGFLIATALALPIGILMGTFRAVESLIEPSVALVRYMPVVAFVPLSILWAGFGDGQKFLLIFIGVFFQQVLMIADNVETVPFEFISIGATLGLGRIAILGRIILPAAAPAIWDTFRITLGWAWTYLVVAELVAASSGLGYRIMTAQRYLQTDTIVFGIAIIGMLGLVTDLSFKVLRHLLFPWA